MCDIHVGGLFTRARHEYRLNNPPQAVLFDKDGTLVCFHSMWTPWLNEMVMRFEQASLKVHPHFTELATKNPNQIMGELIHDVLGYCSHEKKWKPGLFAEATASLCKTALSKCLEDQGYSTEQAHSLVEENWLGGFVKDDHVSPIGDVLLLFKVLREYGLKIAVCTADNRLSALNSMREMGVLADIDTFVCGDDPFSIPKPNPHNGLHISRFFNIPPSRLVMVGDTLADTGMGCSAGFGTVIGVQSGVCEASDLLESSDYVVEDIHDILSITLPGRLHTMELSRRTSMPHQDTLASHREQLMMKNKGDSHDHFGKFLDEAKNDILTPNGATLKQKKLFSTHSLSHISQSPHLLRRGFHTYSFMSHCFSPCTVVPFMSQFRSLSTPTSKAWATENDYIIVGAGSAGCVLANRLTEEVGTPNETNSRFTSSHGDKTGINSLSFHDET